MKSLFTRVGPFLTHYLVAGEGTPVVLLHGGGGDSRQWVPNLEALASQHLVYAPDIPGFGSSKPLLDSYSLTSLASFVRGFMEALELDKVALVGHSMGGGTALSLALECPQRVEKLVLVNSLGLGEEIALWVRLLCAPTIPHSLSRLARAIIRGGLSLLSIPFQDAPHNMRKHIADLKGQRTVWKHRLKELAVPTLVIWGKRDLYLPVAHAIAASQLIPDCRLYIWDNCGHSPCRDGRFNPALLDFLQGSPLS
jgi:4,5:9,10-diseco-3-hydroxy-5,9,17-trioxoandrosta-1(10),2-diene-4-oate hydrolase